MKRFLTSVAAALTAGLVSTSAMAQDYNPDTLRIALLPDENAATVIQDNKPLQDYLATTLGKEIELVVTTDYSSMIEATRFGRIDIAYFGPASYTIAKDRMAGGDLDIEPFAARLKDGSTTYQSVLIAGKDTGLTALDQIKGSGINVAYGDQASTSSHFAPKYTLMKAGIMPSEDYSENFTGAHDAVARNVELGNAEVGGLSRPIFERLIQKGTIDGDKIVVLGYSDSIPQYPWVMRSDMAPELKTAIVDAFLSLKKGTPDGDSVLKPFKADGFAAIRDSDYDIIRAIRQNVQGE